MQGFGKLALASVIGLSAVSAANAAVTVADFENGTTSGFGNLTYSSGVTANTFASPTSANVVTPSSGGLTTKVLHFTGSGFNGGYSSGTGIAIGYDFAANGHAADFLANSKIEFDWEVPTSSAADGYSQLYQFTLNSQGGGFIQFGGSSGSTSALASSSGTVNQYPAYTGQVNHVVIDYTAYKAAITGTGYIQLGIATNNGGSAPTDFYFDNFTLTGATTPEPASLSLLGLAAVGGLARRRRA